MATHDITLPGSQRPAWPDLCVGCEVPQPGHKARVSVTGSRSTFGWDMDAAMLATGATAQGTNVSVKVHVPCCVMCTAALERRHFWKARALYASGILGAVACLAVILWTSDRGMSGGAGAALGIAALLAVLAVPVVYEMKHPPAFTITPLEGRVTYEFVSAKCAEAFCQSERRRQRDSIPSTSAPMAPRSPMTPDGIALRRGDGDFKVVPGTRNDFNRAVHLSQDGGLLSVRGDGCRVWNTATGHQPSTLRLGGSPCFAGVPPLLIGGQSEGSFLEARDPATGDLRWRTGLPGVSATICSASADGTLIAAVASDGSLVLVESASGRIPAVLQHADARLIQYVSFNPDGTKIAAATAPGTVLLWEPPVTARRTRCPRSRLVIGISGQSFSTDAERRSFCRVENGHDNDSPACHRAGGCPPGLNLQSLIP